MEKKNALIIANNGLAPSGVPIVILETTKLLSSEYNFDLISFNKKENFLEKDFLSFGGKIFYLEDKHFKNRFINKFYNTFFKNYFYYKKTKKILKIKRYDVIHSFKEYESFSFFKAARRLGVKKRIWHSNILYYSPKFIFSKLKLFFYKKRSLKYATDLIGVSKECCRDIFGKKHSTVVPNTYNSNYYNEKIGHVSNESVIRLTQISTFSDRKNQLFSLKVLNNIIKNNKKACLNFIGYETEKNYLNKMIDYMDKNHLNNDVNILDPKTNQKVILENTDFLLIPSKQEAFGLVLLEGQACGIKCIASLNVSSTPNCGLVTYIEFDENKWADFIVNTPRTREFVDMSKFSESSFKNNLLKIYNF